MQDKWQKTDRYRYILVILPMSKNIIAELNFMSIYL